jgi:Cu(I)/Ag(I) efflux system membrane fusion protein
MKKLSIAVAVLMALAAGAYGGYRFAHHRLMSAAATPAPQADADRKVLYWYDPMYPQQKFDKPGKSPFMDMQLVPKYAGEEADAGTVSISPRVVQNLGVRTAEAKQGSLEQRFQAVGAVAYNERGVVQLQARAGGFVEKLYARAPLDAVAKGAPLVEILYPEWAGAQEEYLLLRKAGSAELAQAARQRLLLLGMTEAQIAAVERDGKVRNRFTLTSPIRGVIAELGVREGMTVSAGAALFRLVDLSTVWVNAEVPEIQARMVRPGTPVEARVAGYPASVFKGKVGAILPEVNQATRTLRARIELANPEGHLRPGMYATLSFAQANRAESILVPSEAVIRTGTRDVVIVALGDGKFRAIPVEVGSESGGQSEIRKGLKAGDRVVLSGQFLIDSEASLSSTIARMGAEDSSAPGNAGAKAEPAGDTAMGSGKVTAVDPAAGKVELDHGPIAAMQWPAMSMGFVVKDKGALSGVKPGDTVEFELRRQPDSDGQYLIEKLRKTR